MTAPTPAVRSTLASHRCDRTDLLTVALFALLTVGWSLLAGKDLNWDQLNYHFYVGYSLLNDRLGQDFMAASGQSYLNPLVYVPFYGMVAGGWHSIAIASVLASFHALNIVLLYLLVRAALPEPTAYHRLVAVLGALLGFLSPIFLMEAGTTFADITTCVFLLGALLCLLQADIRKPWYRSGIAVAGILAGAAAGLKLSNLVFGPAFAIAALVLHPTLRTGLRALTLLATGAFAGIVIAHGYWSWQLLITLGDPSSPTLGSLLTSPDIPPSTATLPQRFAPESIIEAVTLPFRMMQLRGWVYVETPAPDLRLAAASLLLAVVAVALLINRSVRARLAIATHRKLIALLVFFILITAIWILTSSNGRYGILVSILCGGALALLAHGLFGHKRWVAASLGALAILQVLHMQNGQLRWTSERWTSTWYDVTVPERLTREPYLYISVGGNSNAYIAPFLAKGSAFTNPIGQYSFDFEGPGAVRLAELLKRYRGRVRILSQTEPGAGRERLASWHNSADTVIARLGFAVDSGDCLTITTAGPQWQLGQDSNTDGENHPSLNALRTCRLTERPYPNTEERARITRVVHRITEWCPKLFRSPHSVVEQTPEGWYVSYVSTDTTLVIHDAKVAITQPRTAAEIYLGTLQDWEQNRTPDCESIPTKFRSKYSFD